MSNTNTGGPAFPVSDPFAVKCPPTDDEALRIQQGMTLRDYFAAKAMQGMLANPKLQEQILKAGQSWVEESAWKVADAMIAARSQA